MRRARVRAGAAVSTAEVWLLVRIEDDPDVYPVSGNGVSVYGHIDGQTQVLALRHTNVDPHAVGEAVLALLESETEGGGMTEGIKAIRVLLFAVLLLWGVVDGMIGYWGDGSRHVEPLPINGPVGPDVLGEPLPGCNWC